MFPIKNETARRVLIRVEEKCPECGGELDTGWECVDCGFDAMSIAYTKEDRRIDEKYG